MNAWRDAGFDDTGALVIERDEWKIVRAVRDMQVRYLLWRGAECFGIFPSAHEAAMTADMSEVVPE